MSKFHITPRAARDLAGIARWSLDRWGAARMETYMCGLDDRFRWLSQHPLSGRTRHDIAPGYRCFAEGLHLVFYIVQEDAIAIIGVPQQAMDVGGHFA